MPNKRLPPSKKIDNEIHAAKEWNRIKMTVNEQTQILALRDELKHTAVKKRTAQSTPKLYVLR